MSVMAIVEPRPTDGARMIRCLVLLLYVFFPSTGQAEDRNSGALWTISQIAVPVETSWALHLMVQNRWHEDIEHYERTVIRPWLSFDATDRVELAVGYDRHEFNHPTHRHEDRAWQRVAYRHPLGEATLLTHLWMEERFFEDSNATAVRSRFMLGAAHPLPGGFGAIIRNEFMVDLNGTSNIRRAGLGEDQLYLGFNRPIGRGVRLELGYQMIYLDRKGPDQFNHALMLGLSLTTPSIGNGF